MTFWEKISDETLLFWMTPEFEFSCSVAFFVIDVRSSPSSLTQRSLVSEVTVRILCFGPICLSPFDKTLQYLRAFLITKGTYIIIL